MNIFGFFIALAFVFVVTVEAFTLKQLREGEVFATECIFKVGINPLSVNRLRKGDFSRDDEKSQVSSSTCCEVSLIDCDLYFSALLNVSLRKLVSCRAVSLSKALSLKSSHQTIRERKFRRFTTCARISKDQLLVKLPSEFTNAT